MALLQESFLQVYSSEANADDIGLGLLASLAAKTEGLQQSRAFTWRGSSEICCEWSFES